MVRVMPGGSCRPLATGITTLYVGTLDSQERITQAFQFVKGQTQNCYWDHDNRLAEAFGIKEVPTS